MRKKRKIVNLFEDETTSNIKRVISISNEEDLERFWDYLNTSSDQTYEVTHTFIAQFYNFALLYLSSKESQFFEVILEENEESLYFTLWNRVIAKIFKEHISTSSLEFLHDENRISVKLNKLKIKQSMQKITSQHELREKRLLESLEEQKKELLAPYTFIAKNDLDELMQYSDDLSEIVFYMGKNGLNETHFISMRSIFSLFCLNLRYYDEVSFMANTITDFSNLLNMYKEKFLHLNYDELGMIIGFINNIDNWLQTLFVKGGADLYFMDNSLRADYEMISSIINPLDLSDEDVNIDSIFEF